MEKGLLIVISGPAGSGKGTVCAHLTKTGSFAVSVSATTREPRPGETDGINYHFISKENFLSLIEREEMLEYTDYCGNYYGTLKKETDAVLSSGKNLILEIEVEGARNIKEKHPDAILILLLPPTFSTQEQRLRDRNTETEEKILARLEQTKNELTFANLYDYVVYNFDGMDFEASEKIISIVEAEKASIKRNPQIAKKYFENN